MVIPKCEVDNCKKEAVFIEDVLMRDRTITEVSICLGHYKILKNGGDIVG